MGRWGMGLSALAYHPSMRASPVLCPSAAGLLSSFLALALSELGGLENLHVSLPVRGRKK